MRTRSASYFFLLLASLHLANAAWAQPAATTTTLSVNPSPSEAGASVTLVAVVETQVGFETPTGAVQFRSDRDGTLGTVTLDSTGEASLQISTLEAGTHQLTASYLGNSFFEESSDTASHTVEGIETETTLGVDPSPSQLGESVTLFAVSLNPLASSALAPLMVVTPARRPPRAIAQPSIEDACTRFTRPVSLSGERSFGKAPRWDVSIESGM